MTYTKITTFLMCAGQAEEALKIELRHSYNRIKALIQDTPAWPTEKAIGGAIGMIVHTAYHLGEIRQALCTLKV